MKNKIIKTLESSPKTFKELKNELGLRDYNDSKKLDKELRDLWKERKIYFKKSKETYHLKNDEEIIGIFRDTKNDYGFVENDDLTVFIPGKFVLNALEGDSVKVILFPLREDDDPDRRAGKIVRVMQRNGSAIIGRVNVIEGIKTFVPDDVAPKHTYTVDGLDEFEEGDILVTEFIDFQNGEITLRIKNKIGTTDDATLDPEIIGLKFELNTVFPEKVLIEAEKIEPSDSDRRVDITDRLIYTIDGVESKDLDDAVDVTLLENGNYRLGVHIADVSHFVKRDGIIDNEAVERGTSVYLINTVFPMLPQRLSNDLCSLNPDTLKFTLSCDMEINKQGQVVNSKVYESKIISKHRLSYVQVDELYDGVVNEIENPELTKSLLLAKELADVLRVDKLTRGMIDFVLPEAKVKLDEFGEVVEINNKFQTTSEKVIEDLMVVTNESVAKLLTNKELPGMFRVHPKPKEENLIAFNNLAKTLGTFLPKDIDEIKSKDLMSFLEEHKNDENGEILKRFMIQSMEKAIYDYEDNGHYALGLKNYLHFTSPIRRYPDLIVHRLIKEFFLDSDKETNIKHAEDQVLYLQELAKRTSEAERNAVSAERRLVDIKKSRFMKSLVGTEMSGKIVSVVRFGFFVEFENLTQGLVHVDNLKGDEYSFIEEKYSIVGAEHKKEYKLGTKINVKIINVDVIRGLIDLEVIN